MNDDKTTSNRHIITIVVLTLAVCAIEGVTILGFCLLYNREVNVALLTAFVGIVNFCTGAVAGVLAKTYATTSTTPTGNVTVPEQKLETETKS